MTFHIRLIWYGGSDLRLFDALSYACARYHDFVDIDYSIETLPGRDELRIEGQCSRMHLKIMYRVQDRVLRFLHLKFTQADVVTRVV